MQSEKLENPFKDIVSGIILGGSEFINWIKSNFLSKDSDYKEKPQLRSLKPGLTFGDLLPAICDAYACTREVILQKGKKGNIARDAAIYLSREMTGESGVALGR